MSDNPSAFPHPGNSTWGIATAEGMKLRDFFAAHALAALAHQDNPGMPGDVAEYSYRVADAMLAERLK